MIVIAFLHLSTYLWCFCLGTYFLNKGLDNLQWPPVYQIHILMIHQQECSRLSSWFSVWCLRQCLNHFSPEWWSTFRFILKLQLVCKFCILKRNTLFTLSLYYCFHTLLIFTYYFLYSFYSEIIFVRLYTADIFSILFSTCHIIYGLQYSKIVSELFIPRHCFIWTYT